MALAAPLKTQLTRGAVSGHLREHRLERVQHMRSTGTRPGILDIDQHVAAGNGYAVPQAPPRWPGRWRRRLWAGLAAGCTHACFAGTGQHD